MKYIYTLILSALFPICTSCSSSAEALDLRPTTLSYKTTMDYSPTLITKTLPTVLDEQSGMAWWQGLIWVINDSNNAPNLYAYDMTGALQRTVTIANAKNIDWESLAEDDEYLYIGDFGNNRGNRKDLKVIRVQKSLIAHGETTVDADFIHFSWADQVDYSGEQELHDYDCEAFFAYEGQLYLFSKDRVDYKTRMYIMPNKPSNYELNPVVTIDTQFSVTGADISSDGKTIVLVGYQNLVNSHLFFIYNLNDMNWGLAKTLRIHLSSLFAAQTEGIMFDNKNQLFMTTEKTILASHSLYQINWTKLLDQ